MYKVKNIGLTAKLILAVSLGSVLTYIIIFFIGYQLMERIIVREIDTNGENIVDAAVKTVDDVVDIVARTTRSVNFAIQNSFATQEDLFRINKFILSNNEELSGISISFEPYAAEPGKKYFSPYCFRRGADIKCEMIGGKNYDYFNMNWYMASRKTNAAVWTDPYVDNYYSDDFILSRSAPFYRETKDGQVFHGVVSADISIEKLQSDISKATAKKNGYVFLISDNGTFITFPTKGYSATKTIWDVIKEYNDKNLYTIANDMIHGKTGIAPLKDPVSGKDAWIFYKPIKLSNWSIGVMFKEHELYANVRYIAHRMAALFAAGVLVLFLMIFFISRRITKPLSQLTLAAGEISHGNLNTSIPATGRHDEVGTLARSFTSMQSDLKKYIDELTQTVTRQERMNNELKIAHDIQQNIVPEVFPAFGATGNIKAFGKLLPAREVGGDLYDCFEMDEHRTFFAIGDVSDKGVHAAMLMAIVSTLLRGLSKNLKEPDNMLGIVNRQILKKSKESMFMTLFCGILNDETGQFRYANAGHVPPVLIRRDKEPKIMTDTPSMVLGANVGAEFAWTNIKLEDGDKIFMYTDGVTEAVSEKSEFFGENRLLDILTSHSSASPEELVNAVLGSVEEFEGNRPLADDIAMLCFQFSKSNCKGDCVNVLVKNDPVEMDRVADALKKFGNEHGCNDDMLDELVLAVEEIMINIMKYAYDDKATHTISLSLEIANEHFIVKIADDGRPFDPLEAQVPNLTPSAEDRPIGGLGIFLAKKLADKVYYERVGDHNQLTLIKIIKER